MKSNLNKKWLFRNAVNAFLHRRVRYRFELIEYDFKLLPRELVNLVLNSVHALIPGAPVLSFPPILQVEPTNACHLNCLLCPAGIGSLGRAKHDPLYLKRCLASLTPPPLPQSEMEILVVDSGTCLERADFAKRLVAQLGKPFRWLPSQGETRRAALYNRAIQASIGEILVFTHDDAYFPENWLLLITSPLSDPSTACTSGEDQVPPNERPFLLSLDYVLKNPFGSGGMRRGRGIRFGYFTPPATGIWDSPSGCFSKWDFLPLP